MWGHVDDRLAPFCEGALPETEARAVAAHLAGCRRCEGLRREVEQGLALVRELPGARLPEADAARIRERLEQAAAVTAPPPRARFRARRLAQAAVVVAGLAAAVLLAVQRTPHLRLEASAAPLSGLERAAVALRREAVEGTLALDMRNASPDAVRLWIRQHTGLSANLAVARPAEDAGRFELLGAKETAVGGAKAAAVVYRIDGTIAVLLTAEASAVADRPREWMLFGKTVRRGTDAGSGAQALTWTNSGQVYTLVSELPGLGLDGCHVCHTDRKRRALIRSIGQGS